MPFVTELKRTNGNFKSYAERNFPLDCEGLEDMQLNEALLSVLGNIGGSRYKLKGLTQATQWSGYVFLSTQSAPEGEVLYVEPKQGAAPVATDTLYVVNKNIDISAQGYEFPAAYNKRHLAWAC